MDLLPCRIICWILLGRYVSLLVRTLWISYSANTIPDIGVKSLDFVSYETQDNIAVSEEFILTEFYFQFLPDDIVNFQSLNSGTQLETRDGEPCGLSKYK